MENTEKLLEEVLKLSHEKEIPYTPAQVKKMKPEKLVDVMEQYRLKELDRMNEDLVDVAFDKFEHIMKKVSLIKEDSNLSEKLKDRKLLRRDFKNVVASLTPFLPYARILEGVIVCAGEVYEKMSDDNKNDEDSSHETPQGDKQDTPSDDTPPDKEQCDS